jgi:hypothetical protein
MRASMIAIGLLVGAIALGAITFDEGEVIHLVTIDRNEKAHETPLWIVDLDGTSYLRSLSGEAEWLARLRDRPEVVTLRGERRESSLALAVDDPDTRRQVDAAMAVKYGFADRFFRWLARAAGGGASTAVRLHPRAGGSAD